MANLVEWSKLTRLQLGRYAEYYAKMEFTLHGFDVYSAEVDDKGIDFIIRKNENKYYDVQVKSVRGLTYVFLQKDKCNPRATMLVTLVIFNDCHLPEIFLIPTLVWQNPNSLFVSHDYDGKKSLPEWGINLSTKNIGLLSDYSFEKRVALL